MSHDIRDVTATSKPRGNYLDPLKACALSGENGVPVGKSESATFSKYTTIIKQSRRNASRASVLNDVERSRFESIVKRMESEHVYHTAVLDRQKRQFRKSLEVLERDRRAVKRYFDKSGSWVATPLKLVDGTTVKNRHVEKHDTLPPIDVLAAVQEANDAQQDDHNIAEDRTVGKQQGETEQGQTTKADDDAKRVPDFPARRIQSMPALPSLLASSMPKAPKRFYTGDDVATMKEQLMMDNDHVNSANVDERETAENRNILSMSI